MKLLLFDIDGTILQTHGIGRRSVEITVSEIVGQPIDSRSIRFSGKTDPQILLEVLETAGLREEAALEVLEPALERYSELMRELLVPEDVTLLPGVRDLIERLQDDPHVQLAVLTGNLEPMARLKLGAVGLNRFFPFGAFGSDSPRRNDLPTIALERARNFTGGDFRGKDVVIIGDTEHDIRCGLGVGAFSIGVCTGNYTRADLESHAPDAVLDDLSDFALFRSHLDYSPPEK